ncbi:hypothetical protein ASZ90_015311 [hydrocarbon metagenome]|uniref:Uncharacterized protein n=1 Tax=hydrocarbon metagenome TaxID=938273 RepID=A0A0W8F271_9ZZZZ
MRPSRRYPASFSWRSGSLSHTSSAIQWVYDTFLVTTLSIISGNVRTGQSGRK